MPLQIYNTLTRTKQTFTPTTPGYVGIYVCGPTVYAEPHLGHARGPIVYDVLRRWLRHQGYRVRFVSNITDVGHLTDDADAGEDKIQRRARVERLEPMEVAEKYMWSYFDEMQALNVLRPDIAPRAAGHIPEQIELIQALLERGHAYVANGSVYFRVRSWPSFGKLSNREIEEQEAGARVEVREEKEDPRDFALWKRAEPGHIMRWSSPWGVGFPGWHIECSAMSLKYLGDGFDIHAGGVDLQFPHHEAEIAQAEAAGHTFARYWMHHYHVLLNGQKMAKSTGNFVTLAELRARHEPMYIRFYLLNSHYRSVLDFTDEGLEGAKNGYLRLLNAYREVRRRLPGAPPGVHPGLEGALDRLEAEFAEALNDDLNTPQAIAAFFNFVTELNKTLLEQPGRESLARAERAFAELGEGVLGLFPHRVLEQVGGALLQGLVELLLEMREEARRNRNFAQADRIRDRLAELGVLVEDTREGPKWRMNP
ncbi:Cysteine--tRNA ligase [Meiothermus luteus]|uniref:Cysteine--tRNA ligase n=1 Tax=Meiothermus luteus TaxID=2026184 RepID=A0A399EV36_9DEIN|nr:cysteine--tRNA ligase [Meiothermus luteus]RIH87495.1 Cysteine--tRNA ligase [Meiothermus luteus]RMH58715.1 MAG: cysteine--tRNA ligase [Deinococcota bacterium]